MTAVVTNSVLMVVLERKSEYLFNRVKDGFKRSCSWFRLNRLLSHVLLAL